MCFSMPIFSNYTLTDRLKICYEIKEVECYLKSSRSFSKTRRHKTNKQQQRTRVNGGLYVLQTTPVTIN